MNKNAIVTLAIGKRYLTNWTNLCAPGWRAYGEKHGYDVICIERPLDDSPRARQRSPAWQKCLVLSQEFSGKYERIIWIDADILINPRQAPRVDAGVPPENVGAVELWAEPTAALYRQMLSRLFEYWGPVAILNYSAKAYYTQYGLPDGFDKVIQTGVLVFSPKHHRKILEKVYYEYEEKGGMKWNLEMRPLSYELLKSEAVSWIDFRFNLNWFDFRFLYYPFLINHPKPDSAMAARLRRKLTAFMCAPHERDITKVCVNSAFWDSFFLHFAGSLWEDMKLVDTSAASWRDVTLA